MTLRSIKFDDLPTWHCVPAKIKKFRQGVFSTCRKLGFDRVKIRGWSWIYQSELLIRVYLVVAMFNSDVQCVSALEDRDDVLVTLGKPPPWWCSSSTDEVVIMIPSFELLVLTVRSNTNFPTWGPRFRAVQELQCMRMVENRCGRQYNCAHVH